MTDNEKRRAKKEIDLLLTQLARQLNEGKRALANGWSVEALLAEQSAKDAASQILVRLLRLALADADEVVARGSRYEKIAMYTL